ncbi:MAG TPA: hypothetical protein VMW41_05835 [Candidatus Bathyarchaeia archaeon]|nr:hypothetical protein [Candidatus Bathyarchaeia archaeon]
MISPESERPYLFPEAELNQAVEATLVHLYLPSATNETGLSLRSYLATCAARCLYNHGYTQALFLCVGDVWGPNYPDISSCAQRLLLNWGLPPESIFATSGARSTIDEVDFFQTAAADRHWRSLASLAFETHFMTIPSLYSPVKTFSVEQVLFSLGTPEEYRLMSNLLYSAHEEFYLAYETVKWMLNHLPLGKQFQRLLSSQRRRRPPPGPSLWRSSDRDFELP